MSVEAREHVEDGTKFVKRAKELEKAGRLEDAASMYIHAARAYRRAGSKKFTEHYLDKSKKLERTARGDQLGIPTWDYFQGKYDLVTLVLGIIGIAMGLFFITLKFTGNTILYGDTSATNCIGLLCFFIGLIGLYTFFRKRF